MLDEAGEVVARAYGPVWAGLPQTPQTAESCAYAALMRFLNGPAVLHGDCLNVVRAAQQPTQQVLSRHRPHAGIMKDVYKREGAKFAEAFVKVPAHVCKLGEEHTIQDPIARAKCALRHPGRPRCDCLSIFHRFRAPI